MIEHREFEEWEAIEPYGEEWEDAYFDGEDLELEAETALSVVEELADDEEWETF